MGLPSLSVTTSTRRPVPDPPVVATLRYTFPGRHLVAGTDGSVSRTWPPVTPSDAAVVRIFAPCSIVTLLAFSVMSPPCALRVTPDFTVIFPRRLFTV